MDVDVQLVIVTLAAAGAALYAVRAVWRQFLHPDDEPQGCHGCPANRVVPRGGDDGGTGEKGKKGKSHDIDI